MKTCPHCDAPLRFLRVMRINYWTPYTCPDCGLRSKLSSNQLRLLGGFGVFFGLLMCSDLMRVSWKQFTPWQVFGYFILFCLFTTIICTYAIIHFFSLEPMKPPSRDSRLQ